MSTASCAAPAFELAPYKSLENDVLTERIQQVRAEMGPRLLILGHHYQQDEVIALSDLRGDSYKLAELAAAHEECRAIAFCGVHFMAETADILANRPERLAQPRRPAGDRGPARHGRRLLAGRHGRHRTGRGLLGATRRSDRHGRPDADHLRQLGGQPEGVLRAARRHRLHVGQRPGGARLGLPAPQPRAVLSRPAPGPQHGPGDGHSAGADAAVGPAPGAAGRQHARGHPPQPGDPLAGALQRPPDVPAPARRRSSAKSIRASRSWSIPSA